MLVIRHVEQHPLACKPRLQSDGGVIRDHVIHQVKQIYGGKPRDKAHRPEDCRIHTLGLKVQRMPADYELEALLGKVLCQVFDIAGQPVVVSGTGAQGGGVEDPGGIGLI